MRLVGDSTAPCENTTRHEGGQKQGRGRGKGEEEEEDDDETRRREDKEECKVLHDSSTVASGRPSRFISRE